MRRSARGRGAARRRGAAVLSSVWWVLCCEGKSQSTALLRVLHRVQLIVHIDTRIKLYLPLRSARASAL